MLLTRVLVLAALPALLTRTRIALLLLAAAVNRYAKLERSRWRSRLRLSGAARALIWAQWRQVAALGVLATLTVLAASLVSHSIYVLAFLGSVWAIVAALIIVAIFRIFFTYLGQINKLT